MKNSSIHKSVAKTLHIEGTALSNFANDLPDDIHDVVDLLVKNQGRVVCTGMGKSGHIARKVSATLASTGTLSFFLHPAEASHGDLGMVAPADVLVAISNSGETAELSDLLSHCLLNNIPIVGISSRLESTLMRAASFRLLLPKAEEACPLGLAPTTSTTLSLAIGDAIAIAVMEQRSFSPAQFQIFHPGGRLGSKLSTVSQMMHTKTVLPLVIESTPMSQSILTMTQHGFGITGVIDGSGMLLGVITDGDLRRNMDKLLEKVAGDVATKTPITVHPLMTAAEAVGIMNRNSIHSLFVVNSDNWPIGLLRLHDCLRAGIL